MRPDAVGLFWQDIPVESGKRVLNRIQPDIPATGWVAPREFPRLDCAPYLSIDTETYDPELIDHGPGWARGKGHIVGVSIAVPGAAWYFPVRHTVRPEENMDPLHVFSWLQDITLAHGKKPVIGANLMYDLGWLQEENIHFRGPAYDVQFAEALLSEASRTNLDDLGVRYLQRGKNTNFLYQWCADYYGGKATGEQRANIYRSPPSLVGPYAEEDAAMPAEILPYQWARMVQEGLMDVFHLETGLIPLLLRMRRNGVAVDVSRASWVRDELATRVKDLAKQLDNMAGFPVNCNANESLQKLFKSQGISIPLHHKTGKTSFSKETLLDCEHPLAEVILKLRKFEKVRSTFVESYILNSHVNGKLHCSIHPLRGDKDGTRSGRFSYSKPNGENIPSRDEEMAPLVRSCFIPHVGHRRWRRYDYSQIQYRGLAHYAVGPGSDALRARYCSNPKTDYHDDAQAMVTGYTQLEIPRKPIKNFNFGMTFGMGKAKMVRSTRAELLKLGRPFKLDGEQLFQAYHEACPYVKATLEHYARQALSVGHVTSILGRRSRFDLWEPSERTRNGDRKEALPYEQAAKAYGRIQRAYSHRALNRMLQGVEADLLKKALLVLWNSGVFDYTGVPVLLVHDEVDFSDPLEESDPHYVEAWRYIQHVMETAITLRVPVMADLELGPSWGQVE